MTHKDVRGAELLKLSPILVLRKWNVLQQIEAGDRLECLGGQGEDLLPPPVDKRLPRFERTPSLIFIRIVIKTKAFRLAANLRRRSRLPRSNILFSLFLIICISVIARSTSATHS
ncbi:hypothetical protein C0995_016140 [Termitomyces sp. Mi166|nr:hypothetical protein C0995_016140 [Termitomyces sp. Mi166\